MLLICTNITCIQLNRNENEQTNNSMHFQRPRNIIDKRRSIHTVNTKKEEKWHLWLSMRQGCCYICFCFLLFCIEIAVGFWGSSIQSFYSTAGCISNAMNEFQRNSFGKKNTTQNGVMLRYDCSPKILNQITTKQYQNQKKTLFAYSSRLWFSKILFASFNAIANHDQTVFELFICNYIRISISISVSIKILCTFQYVFLLDFFRSLHC